MGREDGESERGEREAARLTDPGVVFRGVIEWRRPLETYAVDKLLFSPACHSLERSVLWTTHTYIWPFRDEHCHNCSVLPW